MAEKFHVPEDWLADEKNFLAFLIPETEDWHSCCKSSGEISCGGGWGRGKVNTERMKYCPVAHSWTLQNKKGWQALDQINYIPEICRKPQGVAQSFWRSPFDIMFCVEEVELSNGAKDVIHLVCVQCSWLKAGKPAMHQKGGRNAMIKRFALKLLLFLRP